MKSKATNQLRDAVQAWLDERTVHIVTAEEIAKEKSGPCEGYRHFLPEEAPTEESGVALASACDELAAEAARVGLVARPALVLARTLRLRGYVDVEYSLLTEVELLADEVDLRQTKGRQGLLGSGGPAKTLAAVCRAVRAAQAAAGKKRSDRISVTLDDIKRHLAGQDPKKAADYLAPSGKLCEGMWIQRIEDRVLLTPKGKRDGERSLGR